MRDPPAPATILIVEDEKKLANLLADYLRGAHFETLCLADGREVAPAVRANDPDLILLDLVLPGRDGITVCRELRALTDPTKCGRATSCSIVCIPIIASSRTAPSIATSRTCATSCNACRRTGGSFDRFTALDTSWNFSFCIALLPQPPNMREARMRSE